MIDSHLGQAAFRVGFYIAFVSGILSFVTEPSSPERVISILTFIISVLFLIILVILVRISSRRDHSSKE